MRDNKGISLVELIIIIGMIAVLSGVGLMMITSLSGWQVERCAQSISSVMNETKVESMSVSSTGVVITCNDDGNYILQRTYEPDKEIASFNISITYADSTGATEIAVDKDHPLTIQYDRSSGAFKDIGKDASGSSIYCNEIVISNGSHMDTIVLMKDTGKHYIK